MNAHADKTQKNKSQSVANKVSQKQSGGESTFEFVDNRAEAIAQRKRQEIANNSPQAKQVAQLQTVADNYSAKVPPRHSSVAVIQRQLLPIGRHREIVRDAAKRLNNPRTASDNDWIQAIYQELDGEGHPAANKCVQKLIDQRIIDQNDWDLIHADFKLFKSKGAEALLLHERHNTPPVHNDEEADKWVASLIKNRIEDLYSTLPGFVGHAQQVQQSITSLVQWYKENKFSKDTFDKSKDEIITAMRKGKAVSQLPIPEYIYTFEDYTTVKI